MSSARRIIYEFGPFRLDAERRLLSRNGTIVPLTPKNFDLLLTMVQHRGQVMSKEELLRRVWPRTSVEGSNLTQNIFVLRKFLGETPNDHNYIVTAPNHGYRWVAPVREIEDDAGDTMGELGSISNATTIAVLPFKNIGAIDDEYLGSGLAGSLIARLNRLSSVIARPTTSVLKYADPGYGPQAAGRELGVSVVLDGTIQRAGSEIRVNVELIRVHDAAPLWTQQFNTVFTNLFSTEDAIAEEVVRSLQVTLTGAENQRWSNKDTENIEAYQLYIKGRFFWEQRTRSGLLKGIEYAEKALALDPNYVRAHIGLADSYSLLGQYLYLSPSEAFPRAREAAERALGLDDSFAEAHASLAEVLFFYDWNWASAEAQYQRACELDPHYASARHFYAWFLMMQGRSDDALTQIRIAQRLDPGSLTFATAVGLPLYYRGDYEQAAQQYREALEMNPNFALAHYYLALAQIQLEQFGDAIASLRKVKALDYQEQVTGQLGYAYGRLGRRPEALKMLAELRGMRQRQYVSPYIEAIVHAGLNDHDSALERLEQAYEERAPWMVFLQADPTFVNLRGERRFRSLLQRLWP